MITLTEKELQEIISYIQEMPLKNGLPLLNFFNQKIAEQIPQQQIPEQQKIKGKTPVKK